MAEMSEAENTQRIINIFDDIAKRIREERERVERGYGGSSPFWHGYATALYHLQDAVNFWKNEEEAVMATNVTEKDKTLKQVIDWCKSMQADINLYLAGANWLDPVSRVMELSKRKTYGKVIEHCESMLGYSGSMPAEVHNQSEDAK